jgi:hypothetical protein
VNEGEYGGCILYLFMNRRMKPIEIVLRKENKMEKEDKSKIYCSTYVNLTMYPPAQPLYANTIC